MKSLKGISTILSFYYPLQGSWRGHLEPSLGQKIELFTNKSNRKALNQRQNMFNWLFVPNTNCYNNIQPLLPFKDRYQGPGGVI